jgi:hypothetical protein
MRAVFNWLLRDIRADLKGMETRMSDKLDKIQAAEDRLGASIARATAVNAANVKALADAIAKAQSPDATNKDDAALDKILATTIAHADNLDAAFPGVSASEAEPGATGATAVDVPASGDNPGTGQDPADQSAAKAAQDTVTGA